MIILRIEGEPGAGQGCGRSPIGQQGAFAGTSQRRNQDQPALVCKRLVEALSQASAIHPP